MNDRPTSFSENSAETLPENAALWASLPLPALLIGPTEAILALNPATEAFFNLSKRNLLGQILTQRVESTPPLAPALIRARASQSPLFINDAEIRPLGGGAFAPQHCTLHINPMHDAPQNLLVLISPRKIADQLERSTWAKSSSRSAIGMADMLTHEIKNPLAGILGAAQLLATTLNTEDQELTDLIVNETKRIAALLDEVEQFGRQRPPKRRAINLHDALDRARQSAQMGFASQMRIIEDYDPSLPPTYADSDQLMQVFLNLIKNAAEACQNRGTIRLRSYYDGARRFQNPLLSIAQAHASPENLTISAPATHATPLAPEKHPHPHFLKAPASLPLVVEIIDDGPGLPADIASQIFEPFISGHDSRKGVGGKGLGLAVVSKIIAEHDGWIEVDSRPGHTVFRVSLPLAPKGRATETATKAATKHPSQDHARVDKTGKISNNKRKVSDPPK